MTLVNGRELTFAEKRAIVLDRAHYVCVECGAAATEADHIWPRSLGGDDDLTNLQAMCKPCNAAKGARPRDHEWSQDGCRRAATIRLQEATAAVAEAATWIKFGDVVASHRNTEGELTTIERVAGGEFAGRLLLCIYDDGSPTVAPTLLDDGTVRWLTEALTETEVAS